MCSTATGLAGLNLEEKALMVRRGKYRPYLLPLGKAGRYQKPQPPSLGLCTLAPCPCPPSFSEISLSLQKGRTAWLGTICTVMRSNRGGCAIGRCNPRSLSARGGVIQPDRGTGRDQQGRSEDIWSECAMGRRVEKMRSFLQVFVKYLLCARLCYKHWVHIKQTKETNKKILGADI